MGTVSLNSITISEASELNKIITEEELAGKADTTQVLTDVPAGAKFTDTVYVVNNDALSPVTSDNKLLTEVDLSPTAIGLPVILGSATLNTNSGPTVVSFNDAVSQHVIALSLTIVLKSVTSGLKNLYTIQGYRDLDDNSVTLSCIYALVENAFTIETVSTLTLSRSVSDPEHIDLTISQIDEGMVEVSIFYSQL